MNIGFDIILLWLAFSLFVVCVFCWAVVAACWIEFRITEGKKLKNRERKEE